jgi:teichuronic acid biosynthesis glycosyltransferase TuaG
MKKKISVIIPYFKNLKYLPIAIKSVVDQKFRNYEIILIYDDTSKEDLIEIKKKYKKLKNFTILINKKNKGAAVSRNIGLLKSKGEYIAFLDADDYWKKNKLKKQLNFMEKNFIDFSYTAYDIIFKNFKKRHSVKNTYSYYEMLAKCDIGLSTVIISSNILKNGYFPKLKTQEDYGLWLKYLRKGVKVGGLNISLSCWRNLENSLSKNTIQKLRDSFTVYNKLEKKNFLESIFRVLILSMNKLIKTFKNKL